LQSALQHLLHGIRSIDRRPQLGARRTRSPVGRFKGLRTRLHPLDGSKDEQRPGQILGVKPIR
jgi:hypothetical protein